MQSKIIRIILSREFIFRFIAAALFIIGVGSEKYRFFWIISSGITLGIYYGWYNDLIWRPTGKLYPLIPYRAHQLWIHIICGAVGSIAIYFLLGVVNINDPSATLAKLGIREFILFVVGLLGYVGLLPRIIWFFSYAQSIFSKQ